MRRWCFLDLVTDHQTGKLRETAIGSVAFKISALWAYVKFVSGANFETMTAVAGGIFLVHEIGARVLNMKQGELNKETPTKL